MVDVFFRIAAVEAVAAEVVRSPVTIAVNPATGLESVQNRDRNAVEAEEVEEAAAGTIIAAVALAAALEVAEADSEVPALEEGDNASGGGKLFGEFQRTKNVVWRRLKP